MGRRIVPAELRDNMTEKGGALEMKSPTDKFKKNLPSIGGKKGKNKVSVIAAPVSFTDSELDQYEYWLALQSCIPWLYEKPKAAGAQKALREFMALYAKIKMAMQAVVPDEVNVCVGRSPQGGQDLILSGGWYDTAEREADFAVSFFTAYMSCRMADEAIGTVSKEAAETVKLLRGALAKANDDISRRDLRIADLENAVRKLEEANRAKRNSLAMSRGRLPGKRPVRVKTVPIKIVYGKKRN